MKTCKYCNVEKEGNEFSPHPHTRDRLSNKCKECVRVYNRKRWAEATPEARAGRKRYPSPERDRAKHLLRTYGITAEDYETMLANQNGVCAICKNLCRSGNRLAVDHCHKTGRVRGLLCGRCNTQLGVIEAYLDNPSPFDGYISGVSDD